MLGAKFIRTRRNVNGHGRMNPALRKTMPAALIAIDWGTSSARAYRLDARGRILDEQSAPLGVQKVEPGEFPRALTALLGADDYKLVNYTYFPQDGFIRDPERLGWRTTATLNAYAYGANAPYTAADLNSMFLAAVKNDGTVLTPSYYRDWNGISPMQLQMLQAQCRAPECTISVSQMAERLQLKNSAAARIDNRVTSAIDFRWMEIDRLSGFRRLPLHTWQVTNTAKSVSS